MFVDESLLSAIEDVVNCADDTGCDGDLTVTSKRTVKRLDNLLGWHRTENAMRRDLKYLIKLACDTQDAANPRPVVQLLADAVFTVMASHGNPGYQNNPLIRIITNTLLNLDGYKEHPHYKERFMQYHYDMDALEAALTAEDPMAVLMKVKVADEPGKAA